MLGAGARYVRSPNFACQNTAVHSTCIENAFGFVTYRQRGRVHLLWRRASSQSPLAASFGILWIFQTLLELASLRFGLVIFSSHPVTVFFEGNGSGRDWPTVLELTWGRDGERELFKRETEHLYSRPPIHGVGSVHDKEV